MPTRAATRTDIGFLLSQLGTHAAELFKQRVTELDLTRPQAGLLRLISRRPGQSQQAIAALLGTPPSRIVALADELEQRGLITRHRNPADRRNYALDVTDSGQSVVRDLERALNAHEQVVTAPLSDTERAQLHRLLTKLAGGLGLEPGIHPAFRSLPPA